MMKTIAIIASLAVATFATVEARATPNFPPEIHAHLGLTADPPCAICHQGGVTGLGTVTTPFGKAMRARGLVPFDIGTLDAALDKMAADKVDSLGDGTPDIDDLKAGRDPNVPDGDAGTTVPVDVAVIPAYGCGARVAPVGDVDPWAAALGALVAAALVVSRRKR
jgi:hypothetical protein